jgi:hypothetical protein
MGKQEGKADITLCTTKRPRRSQNFQLLGLIVVSSLANFANTFTNMNKTCCGVSNVMECTCRDMKQSHPRVNRLTTLEKSREILHF